MNKWLEAHPLVLGAIFLRSRDSCFAWDHQLVRGVAHDKYGKELDGFSARAMAIVRIVGGVGFCGFAIYKMIGAGT